MPPYSHTPHTQDADPILGLVDTRSNRILSCNILHPVGAWMPSQTIHIPKELYQYILETEAEDQTTSARATELMQKGKTVEHE